MDCNYFKELLSAYIDNYIKQNEKFELEKHLLECSSCKEYLSKLRNYKDNLKNFEEMEVPIGFEKKVMKKIEENKKVFFRSIEQRLILEISAFLIVFASLFVVYISIGKNNEKTTPIVVSEEKKKKTEEKIEISQKKEFDKNENFEFKKEKKLEEMKKLKKLEIIPSEKKEEISIQAYPNKINEQKIYEKDMRWAEQEKSKKILMEEKKVSLDLDLPPSPIIPEYKITIKIIKENFDDNINKIEEILKNEKIDFKKIKVNEYKAEIFVPSKDFKNILEKIASIEGVSVINYNQNQVIESREIKIEILKE